MPKKELPIIKPTKARLLLWQTIAVLDLFDEMAELEPKVSKYVDKARELIVLGIVDFLAAQRNQGSQADKRRWEKWWKKNRHFLSNAISASTRRRQARVFG